MTDSILARTARDPSGYHAVPVAGLSHDAAWPRTGGWAASSGQEVDLTLIGVPTYATSLSGSTAHLTPAAVRAALQRYSSHIVGVAALGDRGREPQWVLDEMLRIADAGDLEDPDSLVGEAAAVQRIAAVAGSSRLVIELGGDNALTVPAVTGLAAAVGGFGRVGLITIDAHHDLRDGRSNGSPVYRLVQAGLDPRRIVQIGIADFANSRAYRQRARDLGITVIHRDELHERPISEVLAEALNIAGSGAAQIHVDVDVDVCDRSVAPACPASLPGGISASELRRAVRGCAADPRVRSIDFAEVDAGADSADGRTVRLVALCVLEAAAGLGLRQPPRELP